MGRYVLDIASYAYGDEPQLSSGAGKAYVTVPDGPAVGETLQITGQSRPLTYYKNDGMYDARRRDREKNVWLRLFAKEEGTSDAWQNRRASGLFCRTCERP